MGWRNSQVLVCDRRLRRGDDFSAAVDWSYGECEGGRQAKVGENATGGLQHMGALRPDLPIEAMVKMKLEPPESEAMGPLWTPFEARLKTANSGNGPVLFKNRLAQISEVSYVLNYP